MANIYRIDLLDSTRTKTAELNNYLELAINRRVNYPGLLQVTFPGDVSVINALADTDYIEIFRKNPQSGVGWTKEFGGLFVRSEYLWPENEPKKAIITALDYKAWLAWRVIAWVAGTSQRSDFVSQPAELIVKYLVLFNLGTSATPENGRLITGGDKSDLVVASNQNRGNSLSIGCAYKNLLETIAKVAALGDGDYDLRMNNDYSGFTFEWYPGQLGTDRTSELTFAMERGNMKNPDWVRDRIDERTLALIGGAGKDDERYTRTVTGPTYSSSNHKETFVDARDLPVRRRAKWMIGGTNG